MNKWFITLGFLAFFCVPTQAQSSKKPATSKRSLAAVARVQPRLETALSKKGLAWGSPVFLRAFKQEEVLELWVESNGSFQLFKSYPICYFSGQLGPKHREGDHQVPEGFYGVKPGSMNPWSQFHLSFNIGFPNRFDRQHQRTGSYIMIHGNCVSTGCLAMRDENIEEIYALVEAALLAGQREVPVHIFPFHMKAATMAAFEKHRDLVFWKNLKQGYDFFATQGRPPRVSAKNKVYYFQ